MTGSSQSTGYSRASGAERASGAAGASGALGASNASHVSHVQTRNESKTSTLFGSLMPSSAEGLKALCQHLQQSQQVGIISSGRCSSTKTEHWFSLGGNQGLQGLPSWNRVALKNTFSSS